MFWDSKFMVISYAAIDYQPWSLTIYDFLLAISFLTVLFLSISIMDAPTMCPLPWNQLHIIALIDFTSQALELHVLTFSSKNPVISCCFQDESSGSSYIHLLTYWPYCTSDFLLIHSTETFIYDHIIEINLESLARPHSLHSALTSPVPSELLHLYCFLESPAKSHQKRRNMSIKELIWPFGKRVSGKGT